MDIRIISNTDEIESLDKNTYTSYILGVLC